MKQTAARVLRVLEDCEFVFWSDVDAQRVERYLAQRREGDKGISLQTSNYYLGAVQSFCRWMVQTGKATTRSTCRGCGARTRRPRKAPSWL